MAREPPTSACVRGSRVIRHTSGAYGHAARWHSARSAEWVSKSAERMPQGRIQTPCKRRPSPVLTPSRRRYHGGCMGQARDKQGACRRGRRACCGCGTPEGPVALARWNIETPQVGELLATNCQSKVKRDKRYGGTFWHTRLPTTRWRGEPCPAMAFGKILSGLGAEDRHLLCIWASHR